jgi:FAD synthetase
MRVLVFGTFDHLHPGHHFVISEARKRGSTIVIVARDANVERIKGHLPEQSETERVAAIKKAFPKANVLLGDSTDFLRPLRLQPDLILLGYDQKLPPGVTEADFPCPVERLPAFHPEQFKSSFMRRAQKEQREQTVQK